MYYSCLFPDAAKEPGVYTDVMPEYFKDLNLDQIVESALTGYEKFNIAKHYYTILADDAVVAYRQEALRELEREEVASFVRRFCEMIFAIARLIPKIATSLRGEGPMTKNTMTKGAFLNAAVKYLVAMQTYVEEAHRLNVSSRALAGMTEHIEALFATDAWQQLLNETVHVRDLFDAENYCLLIKGSTIKLRKYEGQEDESEYIRTLFAKFAQGEGKEYKHEINENEVSYNTESALLEILVKQYPEHFKELTTLTERHAEFMDATVARFAEEMQFYFSYLDYIAPIRRAGMRFCLPERAGARIEVVEGFDLALAHNRLSTGIMPVPNGFYLEGKERVLVVTGPNQGGKTTFARSVGQTMHLYRIGLSVPGTNACLPEIHAIFTHFEKEENVENGAGKLMDDLVRIKPMLEAANAHSFFVVNEIFASTTLEDATEISRKVMTKLLATGAIAVWVTFIDEMASFGPETVSMMSTVESEETERRTFRIVRRSADGLAHAMYIAKKHALSYEQLMGRLKA